jgi:hypothetical protein
MIYASNLDDSLYNKVHFFSDLSGCGNVLVLGIDVKLEHPNEGIYGPMGFIWKGLPILNNVFKHILLDFRPQSVRQAFEDFLFFDALRIFPSTLLVVFVPLDELVGDVILFHP